MSDQRRELTRGLIGALGLGTLAFGLAPTVAPRWFGRVFDVPVGSDPRLLTMVRSVGVRDAAIGLGLALAARRGSGSGPWLAARVAADAGDSLAIGLALAAGARQPRFVGLGLLAFGATATGLIVRQLARANELD